MQKRSMNVAIFLKHFKRSVECIVGDVKACRGEELGAEKLFELTKLLPDQDELKKLRSFSEDSRRLPDPDKFMILLTEVPSYALRLDVMVLQQEFHILVEGLMKDIATLRYAIAEVQNCEALHFVIRLVLKAGNYMNAGGAAGDAVGFKITSLLKIADTRANKPGMNLMHFVVMEAQKCDSSLLGFPDRLVHLDQAFRLSLESIKEEARCLSQRVVALQGSITADVDLQRSIGSFFEDAHLNLDVLKSRRTLLCRDVHSLASFFCEDVDSFSLEETVSIFYNFCKKFNRAIKENNERELTETKRQLRTSSICSKRQLPSMQTDGNNQKSSTETSLQSFSLGTSEQTTSLVPPVESHLSPPLSLSRRSSTGPNARRQRRSPIEPYERDLFAFLEAPQVCETPSDNTKRQSTLEGALTSVKKGHRRSSSLRVNELLIERRVSSEWQVFESNKNDEIEDFKHNQMMSNSYDRKYRQECAGTSFTEVEAKDNRPDCLAHIGEASLELGGEEAKPSPPSGPTKAEPSGHSREVESWPQSGAEEAEPSQPSGVEEAELSGAKEAEPWGTEEAEALQPLGVEEAELSQPSGTEEAEPLQLSGVEEAELSGAEEAEQSGTDEAEPSQPSGAEEAEPSLLSGAKEAEPSQPLGAGEAEPLQPSGAEEAEPSLPSGVDEAELKLPSDAKEVEPSLLLGAEELESQSGAEEAELLSGAEGLELSLPEGTSFMKSSKFESFSRVVEKCELVGPLQSYSPERFEELFLPVIGDDSKGMTSQIKPLSELEACCFGDEKIGIDTNQPSILSGAAQIGCDITKCERDMIGVVREKMMPAVSLPIPRSDGSSNSTQAVTFSDTHEKHGPRSRGKQISMNCALSNSALQHCKDVDKSVHDQMDKIKSPTRTRRNPAGKSTSSIQKSCKASLASQSRSKSDRNVVPCSWPVSISRSSRSVSHGSTSPKSPSIRSVGGFSCGDPKHKSLPVNVAANNRGGRRESPKGQIVGLYPDLSKSTAVATLKSLQSKPKLQSPVRMRKSEPKMDNSDSSTNVVCEPGSTTCLMERYIGRNEITMSHNSKLETGKYKIGSGVIASAQHLGKSTAAVTHGSFESKGRRNLMPDSSKSLSKLDCGGTHKTKSIPSGLTAKVRMGGLDSPGGWSYSNSSTNGNGDNVGRVVGIRSRHRSEGSRSERHGAAVLGSGKQPQANGMPWSFGERGLPKQSLTVKPVWK
uniref:FH2 domain-containing protein 1 n=1 Tax=Myxine glutinosa TaxID=7769 RepID=UPI00358EC575